MSKEYIISDDGLIHDKERLKELQLLSLEQKIKTSQTRIIEWFNHWSNQVYVSFSGGKDSTVLADLTARICKAFDWKLNLVFVDTGLEYPEIRQFVKDFKVWLESEYEIEVELATLKPEMRFDEVLSHYGYPVISKNISKRIKDYRSKPDGYAKDILDGVGKWEHSTYNASKYKYLIDAPFKIDERCCDVMKKRPLKKIKNKFAIVGTMADDSRQRRSEWIKSGCNSFSGRTQSKPMSFWLEQDVLQYITEFNIPYCPIYGKIVEEMTDYKKKKNKPTGKLQMDGLDRTGCMFCMFGVHLDKTPNRFQRMKETHPKQYEYCIKAVEDGGLGLGKVLDFIGVKY